MARPRKPVEAKLLDGTYRRDRDGPTTPADLPADPPPVPTKLTEAERAVWAELVRALHGIVKPADVPTLAELCRWIIRGDAIASALAGMAPADKDFVKLTTAAAIATDKVLALSARFGLTPADRAKVRAGMLPSVNDPREAKFFGHGRPSSVQTRPRTKLDDDPPPGR